MRPLIITITLALTASSARAQDAPVSFRADIAPILAQRCLACHGPLRASGKLRVDSFARLLRDKKPVVVPGKADNSELYRLLIAKDADERMPKDAEPLNAMQIALFKRWINEGAKFDGPDPTAELATILPALKHPDPPKVYRSAVPVLSLAFSPDGKELASGGYHEVLFWDPASGNLLRRLPGVGQRIHGLAYSKDGTRLAVGSGTPGEFGELTLFDAKSGKCMARLDTSPDLLLDVQFSPDGQLVASAGADRTIRVYDVVAVREIARIKQHADWVTSIAFNRDGQSLAAASYDKMVKVYDPRTGKLQASYANHHARVLAVAFDPAGELLASAGEDRRVHLWSPREIAAQDGTAAQMEDRFKKALPVKYIANLPGEILKVAIQDGQVFSALPDGTVRQHNLKTQAVVRSYAGQHSDWVYALSVHAASQRMATGSFAGEVCIWNTQDGSIVRRFRASP